MGLLSALLATNQPQAVSNLIQDQTGVTVDVPADPAERQLRQIMISDDAVLEEVNDWAHTNHIPQTDTNAIAALNRQIRDRLNTQRKSYERFLQEHPDSAHGYLAYGSYLNDIGDEDGGKIAFENSKQLDPKNPAVWNNLANYYGEYSPVTNAFSYYAEAIRLDPAEAVYYHNLATTVFLFRKDAREFYHIDEQQVFDKALDLYRQTIRLDPSNFVFSTDYADSYYGIKPLRTNDALMAWTNALNTAHTDFEREGVQIHLARTKIAAGRYAEAQGHLDLVTNSAYLSMKKRLERNLTQKLHPAAAPATSAATNSPAPVTAQNP